MKKVTNKRWIFFTSLVLVMVMATAGFAVSGFKGGFGGPLGGKEMRKERMLSKLDYAMQELQITPEQRVKYTTIRNRMSATIDQAMARREKMREAVRNEMAQETPDVKMLAESMKKEARTMPEIATAQIDSVLEIYSILDKDQQAQFVSMIKKRMDRFEDRHEKKGHMNKDRS